MSSSSRFSLKKVVLASIRWYQLTWSPDHSSRREQFPAGYCRYYPTCSEYGYQAIEKYGVLKGGVLALWRLARCNPWSKGGADPLA